MEIDNVVLQGLLGRWNLHGIEYMYFSILYTSCMEIFQLNTEKVFILSWNNFFSCVECYHVCERVSTARPLSLALRTWMFLSLPDSLPLHLLSCYFFPGCWFYYFLVFILYCERVSPLGKYQLWRYRTQERATAKFQWGFANLLILLLLCKKQLFFFFNQVIKE